MTEKSQIPSIRFKGFTDAWEQRKLREACNSFEYGLNAAATAYDGKNKYLRITDIDDNSRRFNYDELTSPETDIFDADNYRLAEGDILFVRTGASVGKTYLYRHFDGLVYFAGFLIRAKIKPEYDTEFVFQNTLTDEYDTYIRITSQRSGQPGVNAREYGEYAFSSPKEAEQTKIGTLFSTLDNLITLHQCKYDKLVNIKKALLENMFPKNGESIPKIRFKGFTDAWEQRKLGELGTILTGSTPSTSHSEFYSNNGIPWVTPTDITSNQISDSQRKLSLKGEKICRVVPPNTILVTCIASIGKNALLQVKGSFNQQINSLTPYSDIDPYYLITESELWSVQMKRRAAAATMQIVNKTEFAGIETMVPLSAEQQQIGALFQNLDNLITLHQRKLEKLKNIKKALLEKMFI